MKRGGPRAEGSLAPTPPCLTMMLDWVQKPTEDSKNPETNTSLLSPNFWCPRFISCPQPPRQPVAGHIPLSAQPGYHSQWPHSQRPVDNVAHDQQHHAVLGGSRDTGTERGKRNREKSGRRPSQLVPTPTLGFPLHLPIPLEGID